MGWGLVFLFEKDYHRASIKKHIIATFIFSLLITSGPTFASNSFWNSCLKIATDIGLLNKKKIIDGAFARILPKRTQKDVQFLSTLEDTSSLPTQQLQDNLARLKKIKREEKLSATERAAFDNLIMKMDIESTARTKKSAGIATQLNLNKPLSLDHTVDGKNAMIEDLNSLIEARKNPLLTKQDKEKISSRIQKLLDSPHEDNPKFAAENNYYFDEFLGKQKGNLESAELGKAINRKSTYAEIAEGSAFREAEKLAFPNGPSSHAIGKNVVDQVRNRHGFGWDSRDAPAFTLKEIESAGVYIDKLIEAQRLSSNPHKNATHLNQMRNNLDSLARAQKSSLDFLINKNKFKNSILTKFSSDSARINKIFNNITLDPTSPALRKDHEEIVNTLKDLFNSKKLSDEEALFLDSYNSKMREFLGIRNGKSSALTDSFLLRKFSNELPDEKYRGTTLYDHLTEAFKHRNSNEISSEDILRLDAHIESLLENTPIKFGSLNEANDSLQALKKFKADHKNSLTPKQLALLEERRKYIFEAASKGNNKTAMEGGAKGNEEVANLAPFPQNKKSTEANPASSSSTTTTSLSIVPQNKAAATSAQSTPNASPHSLSIVGKPIHTGETKFQSKLKDLANALDDKSLKPEDVNALKKEIRNNLSSPLAPEKFEVVDSANNLRGNRLDEIENLAKIREKLKDDPELQNEISQRINKLLSEPLPVEKLRDEIKALRKDLGYNNVRFPDAANTYSSAKISGLSEDEIKLLNLRKSEYEKLQIEFNQFADYSRPTLPTTNGSIVPTSSARPLKQAPGLPGTPRSPALMENSPSRPPTPEEFRRMANAGLDPNDPLTRAAMQRAEEVQRAHAAKQAASAIAPTQPPTQNKTPSNNSKIPYVVAGVGAAALGAYVYNNQQVDNAPPVVEKTDSKTSSNTTAPATVTLPGALPAEPPPAATIAATNNPAPSLPHAPQAASPAAPAAAPSPASTNPEPQVVNVPAPATTDGQLPQDPGTPQPGQPSGLPELPTTVPEEPAVPAPPLPAGTPDPTPSPSGQPSPSPSPSGTPSAPQGNDGAYLPPPPYSAPSSAPSNYTAPPAKKESGVSKFFSAIGNFFSSIFKAILSIFGAK